MRPNACTYDVLHVDGDVQDAIDDEVENGEGAQNSLRVSPWVGSRPCLCRPGGRADWPTPVQA